jgi:hypothetical protein
MKVQLIPNAGHFENGDWLVVDDEGLFAPRPEFFSIKENVHPRLAGNALIIGSDDEGGDRSTATRAENLTVTFYAPRIEVVFI